MHPSRLERFCRYPCFKTVCSDPLFWKLKYEENNLPLPPSGMRTVQEWLEDYSHSFYSRKKTLLTLKKLEKDALAISTFFLSSLDFLTLLKVNINVFLDSWRKAKESYQAPLLFIIKEDGGYLINLETITGMKERIEELLSYEETEELLYRLFYTNPQAEKAFNFF